MMHKLKRIVAIGRERVFAFAPNKNFIFNGAINILATDDELKLWKDTKKNSAFFKDESDILLYKYNTNSAVVFDYHNKDYLKELIVEACGEFIKPNENVTYMKSRSMRVEAISSLEYEIWFLIQNRTNLYNIYCFVATKYGVNIADDFVFYSIPNLQGAQLLDIFIEPSLVLVD